MNDFKMNLVDFLTQTAERIPNYPAIHFEETITTFGELKDKVNRLAGGLIHLGLRVGDFCVLMMPNSLNWVVAYYALAQIGAIVVPVNFLYRRGELEYIFQNSSARAFIGHGDYLKEPLAAMETSFQIDLRIAEGEGLPPRFVALKDLFDAESEFQTHPTQADDPFAVIYTSGTTGRPKGAILTHKNLMMDAQAIAQVRHTEPEDLVLCVLPLFHIYGQTHALNISIYQGLTIRLWPAFDAQEVLKTIEEEKSTILYAVPTMVNRLVELAAHHRIKRSGLRFCISGGASLPVEVLHRFEKMFQAIIYESYGLTECSPTCVENPFGRPTRPGSIGLPLPGFQVRIVDENDHDVSLGKIGELLISGPAVMKGYLNNPEATSETLKGGWLHTGDLGRWDSEGYLYIVDRRKDLIIRGGYNVYPREIEEILYTHPAILEAAVIGEPHADLGEEIAAVIVLRSGARTSAEEIKQYVKERVAPYKYPRLVKFVTELPKTPAGKIFKRGISLK